MANIAQTVRDYKLLREEDVHHANANGSISSSGTLNLHVENPADSGVKVVLTRVKITSTGPVTISVPHGFTVSGNGTALDVDNNVVGSTSSPDANVYQDSTFGSADHTHEEYVGSGGTGQGNRPPTGGESEDVAAVILEDNDYIVEVTNDDDTNSHNISITVEFYESPSN